MKPNIIKIVSESGSLQVELKDVNILTGDNGSGKTKTLFSLHEYFKVNHSNYQSFIFDMGEDVTGLLGLIYEYKSASLNTETLDLFKNKLAAFNLQEYFYPLVDKNMPDKYDIDDLPRGVRKLIYLLLSLVLYMPEDRTEKSILFIDEPESSLHLKHQLNLISELVNWYPNCIIVAATHSPGMFCNGWNGCVYDMDYIFTSKD